jgi:hypothetical protein
MNRIVREHYPVSKLPDDLREGLDLAQEVTVTVVAESASMPRRSLAEIFASRQPPYLNREQIDRHIDELREDRDDI